MPNTWPSWGKGGDPFNPKDAIPAQARFMCHLLSHVPGKSPTNALAAYNAGIGAVKKYGGVPPYKETQQYVVKISQLQEQN